MIEQILGWLGNICFLIGAILLTQKKIYGFYVQFIANLLYLIQSSLLQNFSLFWLSLVLMLINFYGAVKWEK